MRHTRAFTTIELTLGIIIIAILVSLGTIALSHLRRDSLRTQADNNTTILNQAAARARLKDMQGPGTYGSDKHAALQWYLQHNLIQKTQTPNISLNTYEHGRWFSNSLDLEDISNLNSLTEEQRQELLRRYQEWTPMLAQQIVDAGWIDIHPQANVNLETGLFNPAELLRVGNTLINKTTFHAAFGAQSDLQNILSNGPHTFLSENDLALFETFSTNGSDIEADNGVLWYWNSEDQSYHPGWEHFSVETNGFLAPLAEESELKKRARAALSVTSQELNTQLHSFNERYANDPQGKQAHHTAINTLKDDAKAKDQFIRASFRHNQQFQQAVAQGNVRQYLQSINAELNYMTSSGKEGYARYSPEMTETFHLDFENNIFTSSITMHPQDPSGQTVSVPGGSGRTSVTTYSHHSPSSTTYGFYANIGGQTRSGTLAPDAIARPLWKTRYQTQYHAPQGKLLMDVMVDSDSEPDQLINQSSRNVNVSSLLLKKVQQFHRDNS